jgi:hypothetical protein
MADETMSADGVAYLVHMSPLVKITEDWLVNRQDIIDARREGDNVLLVLRDGIETVCIKDLSGALWKRVCLGTD